MQFKIMRHHKIPPILSEVKNVLDIGCGRNKLPGAVGLDHVDLPGVDIVADLNHRLPFEDNKFEAVHANQILEHVENFVGLVYEVYRILQPGGIFIVHAPYFRSSWAHIDPTHLRNFTINSMDYFVKGTYCYENYRFRDDAFKKIEVFLDLDYESTIARKFFSSKAISNPMKYENSFWSFFYPFEQITYLLTK